MRTVSPRVHAGLAVGASLSRWRKERHMDKKVEAEKKIEMRKVRKIVVNKLNTRTGIKALGGSQTNNSCCGRPCVTK
jgi:hypothetical protein